jgi:2-amino-4-hydroxy-6-hydroxymethyldihydropteridine diphosphokinase
MAQSYWFHFNSIERAYGLINIARPALNFNISIKMQPVRSILYFYGMHKACILLGSNMGRRKDFLRRAKQMIGAEVGGISKESGVYETAAWGKTDQQAFLNQVILVETKLLPDALMQTLLKIEQELGRIRTQKFGPRTIDLDILFYDDLVLKTKLVTIPHPAIQERRFVLVPLVELSPRKIHPVYHQTVATLLRNCTDELAVKKL